MSESSIISLEGRIKTLEDARNQNIGKDIELEALREENNHIKSKIKELEDNNWPNCAIPGCQNKSCRSIGSKYCSPHAQLDEITKLLDENVVATHCTTNKETLSLSIFERIKCWSDAKQTLINARNSRIEDLIKNRNTLQAKLEAKRRKSYEDMER